MSWGAAVSWAAISTRRHGVIATIAEHVSIEGLGRGMVGVARTEHRKVDDAPTLEEGGKGKVLVEAYQN